MKSKAQIAYEAYVRAIPNGTTLPEWEHLPSALQDAWTAAALAVTAVAMARPVHLHE